LSAQLIQDMDAHWPSIDLITQYASFGVQHQKSSCGFWHRSLRMIMSFHCGCTRTS